MTTLPLDPVALAMALNHALTSRWGGMREDTTWEALDLYLLDVGNVRHFKAREIAQTHQRNGVRNTIPHPLLWGNIVPTLHVLEWLRSELGDRPIHITSGYRDGPYNLAVGGSKNSLHKRFNALDFYIDGVSPKRVAETLERHTEAHLMGVGTYPDRGFNHLDMRGLLGMDPWRWEMGKTAA